MRTRSITAPRLLDGEMNGPAFHAYVADVLAPTFRLCDKVVMDNLPTYKAIGVREHIEAVEAHLPSLPADPRNFSPIEMAFEAEVPAA